MGSRKFTLAILLLISASTVGCANTKQPQPVNTADPLSAAPQQPSGQAISRATRISQLLTRADAASSRGDVKTLSDIVTVLVNSGVGPVEGEAQDPIPGWIRQAEMTGTPMRGRLLGPGFVRGQLAPGESWRREQTFFSGKPSTLSVTASGAGKVRMRIVDSAMRTVCQRASSMQKPCEFTPIYTQRYRIELTNEGNGNAIYYLVFD